MGQVAKHRVPAGVAVDEAGVGIPVPDAIADQFQDGVQYAFVQIGQVEPQHIDVRGISHRCSLNQP
ncbi:hypothetical protein D3C84_1170190 [compost metagenome]